LKPWRSGHILVRNIVFAYTLGIVSLSFDQRYLQFTRGTVDCAI
jgi:hypothetical protein